MTAEVIGPIIAWTWIIGMLVSLSVIRVRAGAGFWYGLKVFGPNGFGLVWTTTVVVCSMFWPITLVVWLARGRPEPRVVFNEKAIERQQRQMRSA